MVPSSRIFGVTLLALLTACSQSSASNAGNTGEATGSDANASTMASAAPAASVAPSGAPAAASTTPAPLETNADASKLGVPVYPGAKPFGVGVLAQGSTMMASFLTSDSFDRVEAFYKGQLPAGSEQLNTTSGNKQVAMLQTKAGDDIVVVELSTGDSGGTRIIIKRGSK